MSRQRVQFHSHFQAPPAEVFALFADHRRFGQMLGAPVRRIRDAPGEDPNGVGSIRRIALGPAAFEETVLTFEPPTLIEYTVTRGSPLKNHHGRMAFKAAADGGTELDYHIAFESKLPGMGPVIAMALKAAIGRGLQRAPRFL